MQGIEAYNNLVAEITDGAQIHTLNKCRQSLADSTIQIKNLRWKVYYAQSAYKSRYLLRIHNIDYSMTFLNGSLFVSSGTCPLTEEQLKEIFTDSYIDTLLTACKGNHSYGSIHDNKHKGRILWNFYNYQIKYIR